MNAGELKKGKYIQIDDYIYIVVECMQTKQARSSSIIKTKLKNIETGNIVEKKFNPAERIEQIILDRRQMQYLYRGPESYFFMDLETYEQIDVEKKIVADIKAYMKESMILEIHFYKDNILTIIPPLFVNLIVTVSELGLQGDSSRAGTKPVTLETGLEVRAPLFINKGDIIKIDTRTGEYVERV